MKNSIILLSILAFGILSVDAQNILPEDSTFQDPELRRAHIFEHLNLPNILWNNGVELLDLSQFDGTDNPSVVSDIRIFGMAYASIYSIPKAPIDQLPNPDVAYTNEYSTLDSYDDIPILAIDYSYNRIKPNAVDDNILFVDNDQLKEVPGNTQSPYESLKSFIASPMLLEIHNQSPSFVVKSQHYFGNTGKIVGSASIDFGDGNGYQSIALNVAKTVFFSAPGEKTFKIKYVFTDGTWMQCRSIVQIIFDLNAQNQNLSGEFGDDPDHTTTEPSNGTQVDIYINFNCIEDGLRKPLIFVEGYNPPEVGELGSLVPNGWLANVFYENEDEDFNMFTLVNDEGYDLIYIDYHDGGASIQSNAAAVIEAIEWINAEKFDNNSTEPNVLIGSSMGGLVGKYALRTMEIQNIDHDTELFVAMDSPMRGANIPLGVQYTARDIPNIDVAGFFEMQDFIPQMSLGIDLLNRPATRQLVIFQCPPNTVEGVDENNSSLYESFMNEFHGLGDLQNVREIAISNGSQFAIGQPYPAHTKYLNAGALTWLPGVLIGTTTYFDINIWALPNNPPNWNRIYKGSLIQTVFGIPVAIHSKKIQVKETIPMDTCPGGYYNFDLVSDAYNGFADGVPWILDFALGLDLNEIDEETFCSIPSISSIDKEGEFDVFFDMSNNLARVTDGTTHFKNYIGELEPDDNGFNNHEHEEMTDRNSEFLRFDTNQFSKMENEIIAIFRF